MDDSKITCAFCSELGYCSILQLSMDSGSCQLHVPRVPSTPSLCGISRDSHAFNSGHGLAQRKETHHKETQLQSAQFKVVFWTCLSIQIKQQVPYSFGCTALLNWTGDGDGGLAAQFCQVQRRRPSGHLGEEMKDDERIQSCWTFFHLFA